jgi:ribosomal protein S18 acetylase RimI-like enzyme
MREVTSARVLVDGVHEQWSVLHACTLVAVIGMTAAPAGQFWVVTDFVVDPQRRRCGWGGRAWRALMQVPQIAMRSRFRAFVAEDNPGAQAFFAALGWETLRAPTYGEPFWTIGWRR